MSTHWKHILWVHIENIPCEYPLKMYFVSTHWKHRILVLIENIPCEYSLKTYLMSTHWKHTLLVLIENVPNGYLLESPHWGNTNEDPQGMFSCKNKEQAKYIFHWNHISTVIWMSTHKICFNTVVTLSIGTPYLLIIFVPKIWNIPIYYFMCLK